MQIARLPKEDRGNKSAAIFLLLYLEVGGKGVGGKGVGREGEGRGGLGGVGLVWREGGGREGIAA